MTPDPLQGLREIHLPPAVSWWPPAWGWWVVPGLALLTALGVWWWRQRTAGAKGPALAVLERLAWEFSQEGDGARLAAELSTLLRRVALSRAPRQEVAGLTGEAWLRFLDDHGGEGAFLNGPGRVLLTAPYRPGEAVDGPALLALVERWIRSKP